MEAVADTMNLKHGEAFLERRSHPRFEVREGVIACLHLTAIGQITNISQNGLAFRYVARQDRSVESSILHISKTDRTFNLGLIPVKVVRDIATPGSFSWGTISLRVCCVEFGELEDYQVVALRYFIQKHSKHHCED